MSLFKGEKLATPIVIDSPTFKQTPATSASAGATQAVPATVLGYLTAYIVVPPNAEPVAIKIPYFAA